MQGSEGQCNAVHTRAWSGRVDARTPATEAASSWALLRFVSLKLYLKEETEGQEKC